MKVIEFIKRNISIFNIISIFILFVCIFNIITLKPEDSGHGLVGAFLIGLLLLSILLLILDFIMRKTINNERTILIIQLLILLIIPFLISYLYF